MRLFLPMILLVEGIREILIIFFLDHTEEAFVILRDSLE